MNNIHRGKIGQLPQAVREEVNRRLQNGERGRAIVAWLNRLPEVRALLAAEFEGRPIRQQNLSQWRSYGYQPWLRQQEALAMAQALAAETADLQAAGDSSPTDQMAGWVSVHYLMAVRKLVEANAGGQPNLKLLREFCRDVVALRQIEHSGARLKLEQERLERTHPINQ